MRRAMAVAAQCILLLLATRAAAAQERGKREPESGRAAGRQTLVGEGVRVWTRNCIRCHNVRPVWERTDRSWATIVAHMRARANLTEHQAEAALAFLQAVNEPPEEGAPEGAEAPAGVQCPATSPKLVSEGSAIFHGKGNCTSCHGARAQGGVGPALTDASQWHRISGSYASIAGLVRSGAPGMPPMGGASLTAAEICAVAAYVYSISHE